MPKIIEDYGILIFKLKPQKCIYKDCESSATHALARGIVGKYLGKGWDKVYLCDEHVKEEIGLWVINSPRKIF
jgi:hypothetical protein